jgi:predicted peptidase
MRKPLVLTTSFALLALFATGADVSGGAEGPGRLEEGMFDKTIQRHVTLGYLLYLPPEYGEKEARWPMLLYLHGGMGRGSDFAKMSWYPLPRLLRESGRDLPFIILMPQCPEDDIWDSDALLALVDEIAGSHAVDQDRIYLVGYSMGGTGAWRLALAYPERFAAIAPMSGYTDPARATRLKGVSTWVFHGAKDTLVQPSESEKMVKALEAAGVDVRFTLDPERGHAPPSDEKHWQLFEWFLTHSRGKQPGKANAGRP